VYGDTRHIFENCEDAYAPSRQLLLSFVKLAWKTLGIYLIGNGFKRKVFVRAEQMQQSIRYIDNLQLTGVWRRPTHHCKTCLFLADMRKGEKSKNERNFGKRVFGPKKTAWPSLQTA
jgi:hypothetical protein